MNALKAITCGCALAFVVVVVIALCKLSNTNTDEEAYSGNQNPLISATYTGLNAFPQSIYRPPTPAYMSMSMPRSADAGQKWIQFGEITPPFGKRDTAFPIQGRILIPGQLYKYQVIINGRVFPVQQTHKLINGDVIDVLGFANPEVRWRVRTPNRYWDRIMIYR